jgi:hypothetical protein
MKENFSKTKSVLTAKFNQNGKKKKEVIFIAFNRQK